MLRYELLTGSTPLSRNRLREAAAAEWRKKLEVTKHPVKEIKP